ncbi:hypothetical protein DH2020_010105 [Rehmannia glutinosa]|uniref:Uncharacterized protein n=1 Tax=Rehmannia glutinosa TaxID=99300 RepID=A0ABR0X866_REHGL
MGVNFLFISVVCTTLSVVGLQYWTEISFEKHKSDGLIVDDFINSEDASHVLELLLGSYTTLLLVASFALNVFVLIILGLKTIFFSELYTSEIRKMLERLINYVIYKGTFLPLVVPPTVFQAGLWSSWLAVLCFLKMFQALARDRLERLNVSPSATPWTYFRVYSALLLVFIFLRLLSLTVVFKYELKQVHFNEEWIRKPLVKAFRCVYFFQPVHNVAITIYVATFPCRHLVNSQQSRHANHQASPCLDLHLTEDALILLCLTIYNASSSSMFLLLFFEPLSIAFETLQAMVVHGFQLLEIWLHHTAGDSANCRLYKMFDITPTGSLGEWKGILIRNLGFFLDMMTMLMALAHYLHIWWLHGMAFHLVDAVLFLNIRVNALLSAIVKRAKGFIKLRELWEPFMGPFLMPHLKSSEYTMMSVQFVGLDQGLTESYSCPTCRKPLFTGRPESGVSTRAAEIPRDEQLARPMSTGLDRPNLPGHDPHPGVFPNQSQDAETGDWRRAGIDSSWLSLDGAGPSGLSRVQMVMRQLAAVGETYAQTALEDAAWSIFPPNPSQASTSRSAIPPAGSIRYPRGAGGLHVRSTSHTANDNLANIIAMAETVREVLPHIPDDLIFQLFVFHIRRLLGRYSEPRLFRIGMHEDYLVSSVVPKLPKFISFTAVHRSGIVTCALRKCVATSVRK